MMKYKKSIIFSMLLLVFLFGGYLIFPINQVSYAYRQVKKIAPATSNYLLPIKQHIAFAVRPSENFHFPIALGDHGPSESLYAGPNQYPFYCMTLNSDLGQPLVDNQLGYGVPVYQDINKKNVIIGYSKDCNARSRIQYFVADQQNNIYQLNESIPTEQLNNGSIFRVEQGTINRFIYTLVMPVTSSEIGDRLAQSQWNKRLIYQFNGGSGIGYRQGRQLASKVIDRQLEQLRAGYAVISSSGNRTSYTYNMLLAEDTARRVKRQFVSLYGEPLYTVGIGGSGGGLAQYLIGQNSQGILDGLIPLYSYPDMITQTTYALDCDLLNNYFTFRADNRRKWRDWSKRQLIEGMNALNNFPQRAAYLQPMNQLLAGFVPNMPQGNSECINGYFGLSSFINNPQQGFIRNFFHPQVVKNTKWSYWQDIGYLLGLDQQGYGLSTWDNVGVQYGLAALVANEISVEEFLDINQKIGAWKPQPQMTAEDLHTPFGRKIPIWLSLWGNQNITEVVNGVAPRHQGSIMAMQAAYRSGQVFIGKVSLPVIDVRHYLENDLDMHHVSASFYSRLRIDSAMEQHQHHVIWISHKDYNPVNQAFNLMDQWLLALRGSTLADVVAAKPEQLMDTCFDQQGDIIAQGEGVFDGQWNQSATGMCEREYPMFSTSRIQAGANWAGDMFKCPLIPVTEAIERGFYGQHLMTQHLGELKQIFPDGVCDYQERDLGRPADL
ncbi:hypothetical protein tinsulaeT_16780 [Thalassotalea insulae]|uniref:DUF6351 domain-containing protein n=1 Tax=Thalassotalea insulae TaxID=2056778 RepID=A0ABQ6GQV5_9GAMM|nr:DUF6351 family protein [Thalassotalea insulae]GLX78338.1 hypothetical protein tinsulaeT_16780 [Thalassotalea insulae]